MRMRTMAVAALAAATLTIGGGAAAFASTPSTTPGPAPVGPGTVKFLSCKDGKVHLEEAHVVPADDGNGVSITTEDGQTVTRPTEGVGPRVFTALPATGALAAEGIPAGPDGYAVAVPATPGVPTDAVQGRTALRNGTEAGTRALATEIHEGDPCPAAVPVAVPALPAR
ncbi:hypothetical protein [Pseudonocardia sp. GCM10023141]|uniref:hypothetical protein n=1 Tax=Pseudonocardia sp. GCM10023141 TaxID=3252653 RepID=UPI00361B1DF7